MKTKKTELLFSTWQERFKKCKDAGDYLKLREEIFITLQEVNEESFDLKILIKPEWRNFLMDRRLALEYPATALLKTLFINFSEPFVPSSYEGQAI